MTREHREPAARGLRDQAPPEPAPRADPADVALDLQRTYGNRAVGRMLARVNETPGSGPDYRFGAGGIAKETLAEPTDLDDAVKAVIEDYFDGVQAMFLKGTATTTVAEWGDAVFSHMEPYYGGKAFGEAEVMESVRRLKNENRGAALLHIAEMHYSPSNPDPKDPPVYDGPSLRELLESKGAYLEDDDDVAIQAIYDTEGKFAATAVELAPGNMILLDEDGCVVAMDDHQNKHQAAPIPGFKTYTGERGNKFAQGKDLAWHRTHTARVVLRTIKDAVAAGEATTTGTFSPSKDAIDGINYDLAISYDEPTGKYVGVYHCNPYADEYGQVYTGD